MLKILAGIILLLIMYAIYNFIIKQKLALQDFLKNSENKVPEFKEIQSGYQHQLADPEGSHDVLDTVIFNPYGDERQAIFITGSKGQHNGVLIVDGETTRDIAMELGLEGSPDEAAYGIAVADINSDGKEEVIIAQHSGVYIYSRGSDNRYTAEQVPLDIPENFVPLSIAVADTRNSGQLDMFISTYVDPEHNITANYNQADIRCPNIFLVNNGDGSFTDKTKEAGLDFSQNTFMTVFEDFNGNGLPDLVPALNTDRVHLYENLGDGTFKQHILPAGYGFWMGIATTDLTGNGLPDIFMTNIGNSIPAHLVKGDTTPDQPVDLKFKLFRNDGDFQFTDIAPELNLDTNVFGWGADFADLTNNGRKDLVVTENYTHFPLSLHHRFPTAGKLMLQGVDGKFVRADKEAGVANPHFGYRAVTADLSGNGYQDLVIANLDGPLRIFLNQGVADS